MKLKNALVVGASGLVGSELVNILLTAPEYEKVTILVRKPTGIKNNKLEEKIIDFDYLEDYKIDYDDVQHLFCCLGTTIKKAKSKDNFKKVDLDYPIILAKKAKGGNVSQFLVVSAMGANKNSNIFYSKIKGQMETELKRLGLKGLKIFRPSLLLGERKEFRFGEKTAEFISKGIPFIFKGTYKKYKPIYGRTVANAMYKVALEDIEGIETFNSDEIELKGRME